MCYIVEHDAGLEVDDFLNCQRQNKVSWLHSRQVVCTCGLGYLGTILDFVSFSMQFMFLLLFLDSFSHKLKTLTPTITSVFVVPSLGASIPLQFLIVFQVWSRSLINFVV